MPILSASDSGDIASGLTEAFKNAYEGPKTAATIMSAQAEVALKNAQRKQLENQMNAANQYNQATRAYWGALPPPDAGSPNQVAWAGGGGQIGSETLPAGGPAPLTPYTSDIGAKDAQVQQGVTGNFNRMRDVALANANLTALNAKGGEDTTKSNWNAFGQAGNALQGLPTDPAALKIRGAQLKGEFDKAPDTAKVQGNWGEIDRNGNTVPGVGGMLTADGLDSATGRPATPTTPGGRIVKMQEGKVGLEGGPFGSPAAKEATVFRLSQKANREPLQPDEEDLLKFTVPLVFPWAKELVKTPQGQYMVVSKQANEQPQSLNDALAKLPGGAGAPAATSDNAFTQGATPFQTTPGVGAPGAPGAGPPAAPGAPAAPPAQSGIKISAPFGPGESSTEAARKDATAVILANNALQEFYKRFNYTPRSVDAQGKVTPGQFIDPQTGQPNNSPSAVSKVVPNMGAGLASEYIGTGMVGQAVSNLADPKSQDYTAISFRFVEPVIRMASGAAISPREYSQYFQMFIPNANDSPMTAAAKLDAMHDWVQAVSQTSTARGALDAVMKMGNDNPITRELAQRFAVKATEKGTIDTPFSQLPVEGQSQGASAAPAASSQAAPVAPPSARTNKNADVERMLGIIK